MVSSFLKRCVNPPARRLLLCCRVRDLKESVTTCSPESIPSSTPAGGSERHSQAYKLRYSVLQAFEPLFTSKVTGTQNDGAYVNNEFADIFLVRQPDFTLYATHKIKPRLTFLTVRYCRRICCLSVHRLPVHRTEQHSQATCLTSGQGLAQAQTWSLLYREDIQLTRAVLVLCR